MAGYTGEPRADESLGLLTASLLDHIMQIRWVGGSFTFNYTKYTQILKNTVSALLGNCAVRLLIKIMTL